MPVKLNGEKKFLIYKENLYDKALVVLELIARIAKESITSCKNLPFESFFELVMKDDIL